MHYLLYFNGQPPQTIHLTTLTFFFHTQLAINKRYHYLCYNSRRFFKMLLTATFKSDTCLTLSSFRIQTQYIFVKDFLNNLELTDSLPFAQTHRDVDWPTVADRLKSLLPLWYTQPVLCAVQFAVCRVQSALHSRVMQDALGSGSYVLCRAVQCSVKYAGCCVQCVSKWPLHFVKMKTTGHI